MWWRWHDGKQLNHQQCLFHFHDAIQQLDGMDAFVDMCERLASRCERLNFDIHDLTVDGNIIFTE